VYPIGPRDGFQNVHPAIPTTAKLELIRRLHEAGLQAIEITTVVRPEVVPQLADCETILADPHIQRLLSSSSLCLRTPVLVPNLKGLNIALQHNVREVAVF
ncbi:uncharacterized protein MYCGRDRAFT_30940, partial [Zymoseptoria tritici IPO323]